MSVHPVYGAGIQTLDLWNISRLPLPLDQGSHPRKSFYMMIDFLRTLQRPKCAQRFAHHFVLSSTTSSAISRSVENQKLTITSNLSQNAFSLKSFFNHHKCNIAGSKMICIELQKFGGRSTQRLDPTLQSDWNDSSQRCKFSRTAKCNTNSEFIAAWSDLKLATWQWSPSILRLTGLL